MTHVVRAARLRTCAKTITTSYLARGGRRSCSHCKTAQGERITDTNTKLQVASVYEEEAPNGQLQAAKVCREAPPTARPLPLQSWQVYEASCAIAKLAPKTSDVCGAAGYAAPRHQ